MKHLIATFLIGISVLGYAGGAHAQEQGVTVDAQASAEQNAELEKRLELSREVHKYISTSEKINAAIDGVSLQLPTDRREAFRSAMRNVLNYRVIEKISVDTMAELFTEEELSYLLKYYQDPLNKSVEEKFKKYEEAMTPEITRMLDKAMMRVRTGGTASGQ